MVVSLLNCLRIAIRRVDYAVTYFFTKGFPPIEGSYDLGFGLRPPQNFTIKDIVEDGFLWAVPRNRRTIERRWKRKFGDPFYVYKIMMPKKTLRVCNVCGDDHEVGVLCPTCYKKVMMETTQMQDAIQNQLELKPVENEVVVLYAGEKEEHPLEYFEGKKIVEIDKPRPSWFSKNLLQQTTQQPATTSDVKPSDLG